MHAALKAGHVDSSKCVDKHDLRVLYEQLLQHNVEHFGSFEAPAPAAKEEVDSIFDETERSGGGKKDGIEPPSPFRRMSLADMREAGLEMQGMAKLRQELSEVEIQEYRDFFEIVDEDGNGTIDAHELKQAMTMMGMDCTDELIQAMVGEVKDSQQELEMDFEDLCNWQILAVDRFEAMQPRSEE